MKKIVYIIVGLMLVLMSSCNNYEGDEKVASYIYLDSMYIETDPYIEGSASSYIADVWVTVDGKSIGAFNLPARIPILAKGSQDVRFQPGIIMNQVSGYRVYYPFYRPVTKTIDLVPDSIIRIGSLKTEYVKSVKFDIVESFESIGIVFDTLIKVADKTYKNRSDVAMEKADYTIEEQAYRPASMFGASYCSVKLGVTDTLFECISRDKYRLPKGSTNIFIELDYYCKNIELHIGIWSDNHESVVQQDLFGLRDSKGVWKKAYLCLTPYITNDNTGANDYYIFMGGFRPSGDFKDAEIKIDNFKLIKYETN